MTGVDPFNGLLLEALSGARFVAFSALVTAVFASFGVLALFRRRVLRSMTPATPSASRELPTQDSILSAPDAAPPLPIAWHTLNQAAIRHRAGLARTYMLGGVGLAVALAGC